MADVDSLLTTQGQRRIVLPYFPDSETPTPPTRRCDVSCLEETTTNTESDDSKRADIRSRAILVMSLSCDSRTFRLGLPGAFTCSSRPDFPPTLVSPIFPVSPKYTIILAYPAHFLLSYVRGSSAISDRINSSPHKRCDAMHGAFCFECGRSADSLTLSIWRVGD